jgi:putative ABC transport system permease protein
MIVLRNIYRNKLRNFLTLLGVAAGILVFVTSFSVSSGFKSQITNLIKRYSIDLTVQAKGAATPSMSRIPVSDYLKLRDVPYVRDVSSLIIGSVKASWNSYFVIAGISSSEALSSKFVMVEGRHPLPGRRELILGSLASGQLNYRPGNKIVLFDNEVFTVTGIFSFGSRIMDSAAVLDISEAQRLLKIDQYINMAFIQLEPGSDLQQVMEHIQKHFPNLSAQKSSDFHGQVRMYHTIDLFVWVISLISLFTCCIVVMNTFFMAVSERTKEIGILMAVGWSRFRVFRMILGEAMIICLAGGVIGNIAGLIFFAVINRTHDIGLGWMPTSIPPEIVAQSLAISIGLGIVCSCYPAIVASMLLPVDALRYE